MPITVDQAVAIAGRVFPDGELKWINVPYGSDGVYRIRMRRDNGALSERFNRTYGGSFVILDQYSGQALAVSDSSIRSAGETFLDVQWAFHYGEALGLPGRILWCIAGFVPLILYITGIIRWRQKRNAAKIKASRVEGRVAQRS